MRIHGILLIAFAFLLNTSCKLSSKEASTNNEIENMADEIKTIPADIYQTDKGELDVTLVGHGSIMFEYGGKVIHVDPYSKVADYSKLPKADLVILTHEHSDHLDSVALAQITTENTHFILSKVCGEILGLGEVLNNGDSTVYDDLSIKAVPAYNMVNKNASGEFYHPKGRGNGYVIKFGDYNVYVAGDTENIPEMAELKDSIQIAFLPKNLPYTMTDEMFVDAVSKVSPVYLYPYHFENFDQKKITKQMDKAGVSTKLQVRPMSNL